MKLLLILERFVFGHHCNCAYSCLWHATACQLQLHSHTHTHTHTRTIVLPSSSSSRGCGTHVVCAICIMSKVLKCCRMCLSFDFKGTMRLKARAPRPKLTQLFLASLHTSLKFLKSSFPPSSLILFSTWRVCSPRQSVCVIYGSQTFDSVSVQFWP